MITVSVNLKHSTDPTLNNELYCLEIVNDGTGDVNVGNYKVEIFRENVSIGKISVRPFVRTSFNALYLLYRSLDTFFKWMPDARYLEKHKRNNL